MKRFTVRFEQDPESKWWVATVPEVEGCLTQAETYEQAEERIKEALSLFVDDNETFEIISEVSLDFLKSI